MAEPRSMRVTVLYSPTAREVHEWAVVLPEGSTLAQAITRSGLPTTFPTLDLKTAVTGVWGRKARFEQRLRDGDRVEIYLPLKVDPKVARRERFRRQGARSAVLFARKRGT